MRAPVSLAFARSKFRWAVHERLWPLKYTLFLAILGLSFQSMTDTVRIAEVEPFKTAIVLRFMRDWPYVLYALALLAAGLFIERFYCRYLCPLGAALAIPARLKILIGLNGAPNAAENAVSVQQRAGFRPSIRLARSCPNECIYCLKCQANYFDANTCLPLKQRALRRSGGNRENLAVGKNDG